MKKHGMSRRSVIGTTLTGAFAGALGLSSLGRAAEASVRRSELKFAGYAYDRVRAIQDGRLELEGHTSSFHAGNIYALSASAFGPAKTYEITEIGLIPYMTRFANKDFREYVLLPIFISRIFRHRNIFVRPDRGIEKPEDLRGKRVATPGYGMSACTWIRGFLQDQHGVKPGDMHWTETTASSDGGKLPGGSLDRYLLPDGFPIEKGPPGVDESRMLTEGKVDALITAVTPKAFLEGHPDVKRLFPDFRSAERDYYSKTGVFPIMHVVAIRKDVVEANPELPKQVFELYSQAKQLAYDDLETTTALKVTLPWVTQEFDETRALMGDNYWSYGVEANRKPLELLMRYTHEQGLTRRKLNIEELFHPSTLELREA